MSPLIVELLWALRVCMGYSRVRVHIGGQGGLGHWKSSWRFSYSENQRLRHIILDTLFTEFVAVDEHQLPALTSPSPFFRLVFALTLCSFHFRFTFSQSSL